FLIIGRPPFSTPNNFGGVGNLFIRDSSSVAGEPTAPPLSALITNAMALFPWVAPQLHAAGKGLVVYCPNCPENVVYLGLTLRFADFPLVKQGTNTTLSHS
ncbi:hypothetical protein, partial [Enterobacter intestinihominis]